MVADSGNSTVNRPWFVYLVRCGDGTLYAGITTDLDARREAHNAGRGAAYTRSRLPVEMVFVEQMGDRSAALRREAAIKKLSRSEKLRLITASIGKAGLIASSHHRRDQAEKRAPPKGRPVEGGKTS